MSDAYLDELLARHRTGQAETSELIPALYEEYARRLYRIGKRIGLSSEEADDVLQDTFIAAYKYLERQPAPATLAAYLASLMRHRSLEVLRARKRREYAESETHDQHSSAVPGETADAFLLTSAVSRLTDAERAILLFRFVEGFSMREIAERLAIPFSTVARRLFSATQSLRSALEESIQNERSG